MLTPRRFSLSVPATAFDHVLLPFVEVVVVAAAVMGLLVVMTITTTVVDLLVATVPVAIATALHHLAATTMTLASVVAMVPAHLLQVVVDAHPWMTTLRPAAIQTKAETPTPLLVVVADTADPRVADTQTTPTPTATVVAEEAAMIDPCHPAGLGAHLDRVVATIASTMVDMNAVATGDCLLSLTNCLFNGVVVAYPFRNPLANNSR